MADQTCRNGYNFCWTQIVRFWRIVSERRKKCHASFYLTTVFRAEQLMSSGEGEEVTRNLMHVHCFSVFPNVKKIKKPCKDFSFWGFAILSVNWLHSVMCFPICLWNSALISLKCFRANPTHRHCVALCSCVALFPPEFYSSFFNCEIYRWHISGQIFVIPDFWTFLPPHPPSRFYESWASSRQS